MSVQNVLGLERQRTRCPLPERRRALRHAAAKRVNSHSAVGGGGDEEDTARVVPRSHDRDARDHVLVHVYKLRRSETCHAAAASINQPRSDAAILESLCQEHANRSAL